MTLVSLGVGTVIIWIGLPILVTLPWVVRGLATAQASVAYAFLSLRHRRVSAVLMLLQAPCS